MRILDSEVAWTACSSSYRVHRESECDSTEFRVESSRSFQPAFLHVCRQIQFASSSLPLYPGPTQPWVPALMTPVVLLPQWLGSLDTKTERSGSRR